MAHPRELNRLHKALRQAVQWRLFVRRAEPLGQLTRPQGLGVVIVGGLDSRSLTRSGISHLRRCLNSNKSSSLVRTQPGWRPHSIQFPMKDLQIARYINLRFSTAISMLVKYGHGSGSGPQCGGGGRANTSLLCVTMRLQLDSFFPASLIETTVVAIWY